MWRVCVPRKLARKLLRFPPKDRDRLMAVLETMRHDPYAGDICHLAGVQYRRRSGDYRIIFDIDTPHRIVEVKRLERRKTTTYTKHRH